MKHLITLILFLSFFSCSSPQKEKSNKKIELIQLSPEKERKLYFSEIVDSISIIVLETSNRSLLTDISKIDYDDGYLFILNSQDKLVYSFDNNGIFKSVIANKGNAPGEILYPQCFALDRVNKEIWLTNNNSFYRYNYTGKYLGNKPYSLSFSDFCIEKSGNIYFYTNKTNNSHIGDGFLTGDITMLSPQGKKKTWFKSKAALQNEPNKSYMSFFTRIPFSEQKDGKITCHYAFSDTIYSIQKDYIVPSYVIDFGENKSKIDLDQISGPDVKEYIQTHPKTVWYTREVIETPNILRFSYNFGFESYADVYYNKNNGHILEGKPINDLLEGYIKILGNKGDTIIGCISAMDVELNDKLFSFISQKEQNELKKITPDSNPILIKFTLKDF